MSEPTPESFDLSGLSDGPVLAQLVATLALVAMTLGLGSLGARLICRVDSLRRRDRRRWLVRVRNSTVLLFALGFAAIWCSQPLHVATALVLVATGSVIATKELWLNLMLRASIQARRKGRIEQAIIRRYLSLLKEQTSHSGHTALEPEPFNA